MASSISFAMKGSYAIVALMAMVALFCAEAQLPQPQLPSCAPTDIPLDLVQTKITCLQLSLTNDPAYATQCCPKIQSLNFNCLCYLPLPVSLLNLREFAKRCTITVPPVGLCAVPIP